MRVLITGATGFLGRYVVAEAVRRGHTVTALVRKSRELSEGFFPVGVSVVRGDVRNRDSLPEALRDIEAVIHLAACVVGDDDSQFASTVVGTENLLAAMADCQVTQLVHCSTFSVYDWQHAGNQLDEDSDLEPKLYDRDGYAISKSWQERLVRRAAEDYRWRLTILRPGFIWGAGNEQIAGIGQSIGPFQIVFGVGRVVPLTYVENCADCFLDALTTPSAEGQIYNVIDPETITAWQYMGACLRASAVRGWRVCVPYSVGLGVAKLARMTSRLLFGRQGKLPGLLVPIKFRARFRPFYFVDRKIRAHFGKQPRWDFEAAWRRVRSGQAEARLALATPENTSATTEEAVLV